MTATSHPQLEIILCAAVEIADPDERSAYLAQACSDDADLRQEVERMVENHFRAGQFLERPGDALSATTLLPMVERPGTLIGRYKLLEQIGEGGMGVVYMAEQLAPVRRKVALKIIKPGMDSRQVVGRFEAERQALAMMDHPHIASVLDGGETDGGRPYFVMELVCGMPITKYCDDAHLSTRDRLQLMCTVCRAIQHAHLKGIIHRDLKPSNVLVTLHDGRPVAKVIDFGVAKAVGAQLTEKTLFTAFAQMIGTPLYMSPEQAEMSGLDVDTRSDVYSLGVLAYELLTGHTPFGKEALHEAGLDSLRRKIREQEPLCPSRLIGTLSAAESSTVSQRRGLDQRQLTYELRGELDWIVMKALEVDRNRRYQSAGDFAADIERYLNDEPVEASPPSTLYRLRKLVRRHRAACTTAALVALSLLIGAAVSLWQAAEATRARELADKRAANESAARAEAVSERQRAEANHLTARQAVSQMLKQVADERLSEVRELKDLRRELLEDAVDFYTKLIESSPRDAQAYAERAEVACLLRGHKAPIDDYEKAAVLDPGNAAYHEALADIYSRGSGMTPHRIKALQHAQRAIEIDPDRLMAYWYEASALGQLGRIEEAREAFHRFHELSLPTSDTYVRLADGLWDIGDREPALKYARKAVEMAPLSFDAHGRLSSLLFQSGDVDGAFRESTEAIRLRSYRLSRWGSSAYSVRGAILVRQGRYAESLDDLNRAIELEPWWFAPYRERGTAYFHLHEYDKALADFIKAGELFRASR